MNCPHCNAPTQVTEKRGPYRDRMCPNCHAIITTQESPIIRNHDRAKTLWLKHAPSPRKAQP